MNVFYKIVKSYSCIALMFLFVFSPILLLAQGTNEKFGQSRVQYKSFEWSFFDSDHFVTYFYLGGQELGKFSILYAEDVLKKIEKQLEFKANKRIQIFIYNDLSDMNQTNIGGGANNLNSGGLSTKELENMSSARMDAAGPNTGGMVRILKNKIFIYYNGNQEALKKQIRIGIAQVLIKHMMFGGNFQEVLQNAVLLNLPNWYTDGLVSYIGQPWSTELDNRLRDGILSGKYKNINKLRGEEAIFVGHAIWHYVEQKYGSSSVPNLLYLTRINRSLESGFLFVLGGTLKQVNEEWRRYYLNQYVNEVSEHDSIPEKYLVKKRAWKKRDQYEIKLSPDGQYFAYATNQIGQFKIYIYNTKDEKSKRLKKGGFKTVSLITDKGYPLLDWAPNGKVLAAIYEKRDKLYLMTYDLEEDIKTIKPLTKFQQVHDFCFTDDPRLLALSAVNRGQSDIYTYNIPSTTTDQLTNDYFDDLEVGFVNVSGRRGLMFSSNRNSDTLVTQRLDTLLPGNNYDLFFYNLETNSRFIARVTNTPYVNETEPVQLTKDYYTYLTDKNGFNNRHAGYFEEVIDHYDTIAYFRDSVIVNPTWSIEEKKSDVNSMLDSVVIKPRYKDIGVTFPLTNFNTSIVEHDIAFGAGKSINIIRQNGITKFYLMPIIKPNRLTDLKPKNTFYRNYYIVKAQKEAAKLKLQKKKAEIAKLGEELPDSLIEEKELFFQSDFNTSPEVTVNDFIGDNSGNQLTFEDNSIFKSTRVLPYQLKFSTDYILTQLDNTLIMTRYEPFSPGVPVFSNPPLSLTINIGVADLLEDIWITGGFRFPFDFKNSEYWLAYENLRNRLDRRVMYYRKVENIAFTAIGNPTRLNIESKLKTNYFEYRMNFPLDPIKSFRWYLAYRNDKYIFRAQDDFSLNIPSYSENWLFAKMEFVVDNTIPLGINLRSGLRFKAWSEIHKQFAVEERIIFSDVKVKLPKFDNAYFMVFGIDLRHYQKIHKEFIWANRFAWGSSIGTRKLIYYLGGVDNWIGPKFDNETPVNQNNNYAFQTLATNMRGFDQNVRNGNSYMVINSELRFPFFKYFFNTPIKSEFVKNFQIIAFTDIGTAWEGLNPYSDDNPLFTSTIGQPPVIVKVEYFKNPVVIGYGFGFRTSIFGYFIRLDFAWGNDSGVRTDKPKVYVSLTKDF